MVGGLPTARALRLHVSDLHISKGPLPTRSPNLFLGGLEGVALERGHTGVGGDHMGWRSSCCRGLSVPDPFV